MHSIFKDKSVISSVPNYFNNTFDINITNLVIGSTTCIFNFNKIVTDMNIYSNTPDS